jgi:hypothetical protein
LISVGDQHRVRRRDLSLGPLAETDSSRRGIIAGLLTDPAGQPFAGAQVLVQSFPETRSGADGRFVVRNVPTGTRQVEIRSVGMAPFITTVDVTAHDTAMIAAQLKKVATLDVVRVTGTMRQQRLVADLEARRKMGLGFVQDSTAFEGRVQLVSVFAAFPHLAIQRVGNGQRYYLTLPLRSADVRRISGSTASICRRCQTRWSATTCCSTFSRIRSRRSRSTRTGRAYRWSCSR